MNTHSICRKASVLTLFILNYYSSTLNILKKQRPNKWQDIQEGQQKKKKKKYIENKNVKGYNFSKTIGKKNFSTN